MNKDAAKVLRAARKLIEQPEAWTKEYIAQDAHDNWISPLDKRAVCWCALGALERASHRLGISGDLACGLLGRAIRGSIADYNDTHTHKQVIGRFDRAIALAEGG
jgi:hypothetical protein